MRTVPPRPIFKASLLVNIPAVVLNNKLEDVAKSPLVVPIPTDLNNTSSLFPGGVDVIVAIVPAATPAV